MNQALAWFRRVAPNVTLVLVGVAVALAVLLVTQQSGDVAHTCAIARRLAHIESEFIRTDAIDRKGALSVSERNQTLAGFRKIIGAALLAKIVREQNALDARTISYWRGSLVPDAESLASAAKCPAK